MLTSADWSWYNRLIWPAPILAYAVGVLAVAFVFIRFPRRNLAMSLMLALFWAGGAATFVLMVRTNSFSLPALFTAGFALEALLIAAAGFRGRLRFGFAGSLRSMAGLFLVGYSLVLYPLIASVHGRPFPRGPAFGVAPCPIAIFTFGMLLLTDARVPKHLVVIPVAWSVFGIGAAFALGVGEDLVLLAAAPAAVVLLAARPALASSTGRV